MTVQQLPNIGFAASRPPSFGKLSAAPSFGSGLPLLKQDRFGVEQPPKNISPATNQFKFLFPCTVPCGAAMALVGGALCLIPVVGPFIGIPIAALGLLTALNPFI